MTAMRKGFFDRLLMPGVAFDITDPKRVKPALTPIQRISAVVTYGWPRLDKLPRPAPHECGHTRTPERFQLQSEPCDTAFGFNSLRCQNLCITCLIPAHLIC